MRWCFVVLGLAGCLVLASCGQQAGVSPTAVGLVVEVLSTAGAVESSRIAPASTLTPIPTSTEVASTEVASTDVVVASVTPVAATLVGETAEVVATATAAVLSFAAIGDYGWSGSTAREVAALVDERDPDLVITLGDNNYPDGAAWTIEENITANYGRFVEEDRFFPALGNHDMTIDNGQAYFDYFDLPGNERYYEFVRGDVHFFALNSDWREPDGIGAGSAQAEWLREGLGSSTAAWQVVYFHAPPFVSFFAKQVPAMDWPFAEWGADLVLAGHAHVYERLEINGITYIVNGLGGYTIYPFDPIPRPGSLVRYNEGFGALFMEGTAEIVRGEFVTAGGVVIDDWEIVNGVR